MEVTAANSSRGVRRHGRGNCLSPSEGGIATPGLIPTLRPKKESVLERACRAAARAGDKPPKGSNLRPNADALRARREGSQVPSGPHWTQKKTLEATEGGLIFN